MAGVTPQNISCELGRLYPALPLVSPATAPSRHHVARKRGTARWKQARNQNVKSGQPDKKLEINRFINEIIFQKMTKRIFKLRNVVAIVICLAGMTMFSGCDKDKDNEKENSDLTITIRSTKGKLTITDLHRVYDGNGKIFNYTGKKYYAYAVVKDGDDFLLMAKDVNEAGIVTLEEITNGTIELKIWDGSASTDSNIILGNCTHSGKLSVDIFIFSVPSTNFITFWENMETFRILFEKFYNHHYSGYDDFKNSDVVAAKNFCNTSGLVAFLRDGASLNNGVGEADGIGVRDILFDVSWFDEL